MPFGASTPSQAVGSVETRIVHARNIACDGGDGPLGHPRVWLHIENEQTFCPYCSRVFRLAPGAGQEHGH